MARRPSSVRLSIGVNTGGDTSPPQKSQCGGRQCYSSPRFWPLKTWKTAKFSPQTHQNPIFFRGSAPNPTGGAYTKNLTPALSPSGFELRPFGPRFVPPLFGPWLRLCVCLSVNFCANRFFSQTNGRIATTLSQDGLQVSGHPGCAQGQGQGQGQRSRDTRTFLDSWNELLRHWRSGVIAR